MWFGHQSYPPQDDGKLTDPRLNCLEKAYLDFLKKGIFCPQMTKYFPVFEVTILYQSQQIYQLHTISHRNNESQLRILIKIIIHIYYNLIISVAYIQT